MEIVLATVVIAAVIFFGALISMGNERQRRAIDNLREQISLWAMEDLRIKREGMALDVRVDDPLGWFSKIASKISGNDLQLQVIETFDDPPALVFEATNCFRKLVFTPTHPSQIRRMRRERHGRLSQYTNQNPLFSVARKAQIYELSLLSSGILFDLELSLAWKGLSAQRLEQTQYLWMYEIS